MKKIQEYLNKNSGAISSKIVNTNLKSIEDYVIDLIESDLNAIVDLGNGIKFNNQTKKLYNVLDKEIKLTKIEEALFVLLLENRGEIVSIEDIHKVAWKGKNMTRFTLRNKIKMLRDKTYYELIANYSNVGYSMSLGAGNEL